MKLRIFQFLKTGNLTFLLFFILLSQLFLLNNLKFTAWPEMTFWPYLILKGWLPYRDIAIAHTPLLLVDLSIFYKIFGVGLQQLKVYTWLVIIMIDFFVFWVAKEFWGKREAILSLCVFVFLQTFYEGNGLWFDLSLSLLSIIVFFLLKKKDFLWGGIFWALAFLVKQTAFWFLLPIGLTILPNLTFKSMKKSLPKIKEFSCGVFTIFVSATIIIWLLGLLPDFLFWSFKFGIGILPKASGQISLPDLKQLAVSFLPFLILMFLPWVIKKKDSLELIVWAFFGSLGAFPRWEMFHFQPAVPFLAISFGLVFLNIKKLKSSTQYILVGFLILNSVLVVRHLSRDWRKIDRFFEPTVLEAASYLKSNTNPEEKIFVVNTWDSIYAMSDRLPVTKPWFPQLSWYLELPGVQESILDDLEENPPKLIIMWEYSETGLSSYKPKLVNDFISKNYREVDKIGDYLILEKSK